jgi:putative transposase
MCRVLKLHRNGFYTWLNQPLSKRAIEDQRLLKRMKEFYLISGATCNIPWIHRDLLDAGEYCSVHRVAKIMRINKLRAQIGYKRRYIKGGDKGKFADSILDRQFSTEAPNQTWVSDITYIKTHEDFLYVATILDLFSRKIVG